MKLVVLAGAKKGASVPIKKSSFVIGRSRECALRAGSEAISRKHCELAQGESGITVRDLGSRNGTYVNDEKIEGRITLSHGDTLRIGPLEFRYEAEGELKKAKAPKVKSVAEAVARVSNKPKGDDLHEEDISDWLLGDVAPDEMPAIGETMSMRTDETRINRNNEAQTLQAPTPEEASEEESPAEEAVAEEAEANNGKKKKKKEPGKLPFRPEDKNQSKDSREAAMQILRDMARRR